MMLISIDPGSEQSAYLTYDLDKGRPLAAGILENQKLKCELMRLSVDFDHMAIEMIASYGMAVGADVFRTCVWIGKFEDEFPDAYTEVYRREVKMFLCNSMTAKDSNIRQALIDRFGPGKAKAIGLKATPGPLYGIKKDLWSALAVAVTWADIHAEGRLAS